MKIALRGVIVGNHKVGERHLEQVEIKLKSVNENLALEPMMAEQTIWLTATTEQTESLHTDWIIEGELRVMRRG